MSSMKYWRYLALAVGVLALVVALAACGSSSSSSSSEATGSETTEAEGGKEETASAGGSGGIAEAEAAVAEALKKPTDWKPPGKPINVSGLKGKTAYIIANSLSLAFTTTLTENMKEAFTKAGLKVVVVDDKAEVSQTAKLIEQAVSQGASVITIQSHASDLISAPLKVAKEAGIPVIEMFEGDPGLPTKQQEEQGVSALATYCYSCAGELLANWATANSGGEVTGVTYYDSDVGASQAMNEGQKQQFAKVCPSCEVEYKNVLVADWAKSLPTLTQTDLSNPKLNYFLPNYDGMTTYMVPAIKAAGAEERVKIGSFNANLPYMEELAKGGVIKADIGSPVAWMGWAVADQGLRVMNGEPPLENVDIPFRLFDESNIKEINLKEPESTWYGVNYQQEYEKLWGLG
ncbi:MAG: sugar ABC transporter substrate-binding protein [Actinobacteria bacterium]|nr:sugar ABC transporter substrate-binding protein [Actinomycetota bacterium]